MSDFLRLTRDEELLADLSVFGLDAADSKELETLIASRKEKDLSFEMAAAAMDLSMTKLTRLPDGLRGKILADGKEWVAALQKKGTSEPEAIVRPAEKEQPAEAELASAAVKSGRWSAEGQMVQAQSTSGRFLGRELIAWAAAAAIGFVIALFGAAGFLISGSYLNANLPLSITGFTICGLPFLFFKQLIYKQ